MARRPDKIADLLVDRYDLKPPVDIAALLADVATVENLTWPFDCDAVVTGLTTEARPRVFIRRNQPANRWPFTAAHEYGHVLIPWHTETATCHVGDPGTRRYEQEANDFASRILVPQRYLESMVVRSREVDNWLDALEACSISAHASILALRRVLPSGFLFVIEDDLSPSVVIESSGTGIYAPGLVLTHANLERGSRTAGHREFRGRRIRWYKYIDDRLPPNPRTDDERLASSILESVLERLGRRTSDGRDRRSTLSSIIGGKLRDRRRLDEWQMYGVVAYHLGQSEDWRHFVADEEFQLYLRKRVAELPPAK